MNKTTYYINGNAVREIDEAAPVRRPQKSTRELEEIRRKKNRRKSARRNQERALSMNRAFVAFLTACVAEMEIPEEFQKNAECLITNLG